MRVIAGRPPARHRLDLLLTLAGAVLGLALIGAGAALAYLAFTTPLIERISALGPGEVARTATGILAWVVALAGPALLAILGVARLVTSLEVLGIRRSRRGPVAALAAALPETYVVAERVHLPDGRFVDEVVAGPHGLAVIEPLPAPRASRFRGHAWEVRGPAGRWLPIENPLDRATRDAERLRRWIATHDAGLTFRVYAAVVSDGVEISRTPECAVIRGDQIPGYLAALPPTRQMTPERLERIAELLRTVV